MEEAAESLPSSDSEFRQAAEWIYDRAFGDLCIPSRAEFQFLSNVEKSEIVRQIANVLRLVHYEKMEVRGLSYRVSCLACRISYETGSLILGKQLFNWVFPEFETWNIKAWISC